MEPEGAEIATKKIRSLLDNVLEGPTSSEPAPPQLPGWDYTSEAFLAVQPEMEVYISQIIKRMPRCFRPNKAKNRVPGMNMKVSSPLFRSILFTSYGIVRFLKSGHLGIWGGVLFCWPTRALFLQGSYCREHPDKHILGLNCTNQKYVGCKFSEQPAVLCLHSKQMGIVLIKPPQFKVEQIP